MVRWFAGVGDRFGKPASKPWGLSVRQAKLDGLDEYSGYHVELDFQNEWLVARLGDQVIATVPHLICLLDATSGEAIGTETARYGQRVALIGITAPALFLSPAGLKYVGPRAMGYDLDPVDPCP